MNILTEQLKMHLHRTCHIKLGNVRHPPLRYLFFVPVLLAAQLDFGGGPTGGGRY
jgi:hypothetical protein